MGEAEKQSPYQVSRITQGTLGVLVVVGATLFALLVALMVNGSSVGFRGIVPRLASAPTAVFLGGCLAAAGLSRWVSGVVARRKRFEPRLRWLLFAWIWLVLVVVAAFGVWGFAALALLQFSWGVLVPAGTTLIGAGVMRRVGESVHCAGCEYEYAADGPERCPECGSLWHRRGGTVKGRRERSLALICSGVGVLALSLLMMLQPTFGLSAAPLLPTRVLIADASAGQSGLARHRQSSWAELISRTLSAEEREELARGLLDLRLRAVGLETGPNQWLETEVLNQTIGAALRERFAAELIELSLIGPTSVRAGEEIVVRLKGVNRSTPFAQIDARLLIAAGRVNGAPIESVRRESVLSVYDVDERAATDGLPELRFEMADPGQTLIEVDVWVVVADRAVLSWQAWNDDGSPIVPNGALRAERLTLRHAVRVMPAD